MKKLLVFLVLLTALFLSACNGITISFGAKNTPVPAAAQPPAATRTQEPPAAPRTERSLIPPTSAPVTPDSARNPIIQGGTATVRSDIFTLSTTVLNNTFNLPGNNTAQLWRITAEMAPGQTERTLKVEAQVGRTQEVVQGGMPEGVSVGIYRLTNDSVVHGGETPDRVLTGNHPQNINMNSSYVLYIRAVNSQTRPQNITVSVTEEFDLVISPDNARLAAGASQTFRVTRKGTNISPNVTWSVAEGSRGGTVSSTGVYTAPGQAGTYDVVAIAVVGTRAFRLSATVTVSGPTPAPTPTPPPLGQGTKGAWVLRDTRTKIEKTEDDQFDKHQVTGTGGSLTTRKDWRSRTDNRSGTVTSTQTISPAPPPSRLVPGTNIEFQLARTMNAGGEPNVGGNTGIFLYWEPGGGPDRSGTISSPAAEHLSPRWATVWNWKVPDKRNAKMNVQFTGSGPGGNAATYYIYEWVE